MSKGKHTIWQLLFLLATMSACRQDTAPTVTIATAANAQYALGTIARQFTAETGIRTRVVVSSSGKHTAQIKAGAPYDIFISADLKYPEKLYRSGLTTGKPAIYAYGQLVLWTLNDTLSLSLPALANTDIDPIALPNPKTAPYGRAALEALEKTSLYPTVAARLVYGESVAQANQFILSGAAVTGFTAAAIVMAPAMKGKGRWQAVDKNLYSPIAQGAVVLKQAPQPVLAARFFLYLFSPPAGEILQRYGYTVNKKAP